MKCKTCSHPQRQAIDQALLNDTHTFEALGQHYGLSISSLFRHKKHLVEKMHKARQRFRDSQQQGCLLKLNAILDHVQRAVQTAEAEGKLDQVIRGSHVSGRLIDRISAMEVPLELDTVYRLISSPQWVSQDSLLPTDPNIITGIHQSLVETVFFPCPELILEPAAAADEEDEEDEEEDNDDDDDEYDNDHEEENDAADSLPLDTHTQLRELLADLLAAAGAVPENECKRNPAKSSLPVPSSLFPGASPPADLISNPETSPKSRREKSAKEPKNFRSIAPNILEDQSDNRCEKNLPKNPRVGRESVAPPAVKHSELRTASCDADKVYEEYLRQKAAAENQLKTQDSELSPASLELETPPSPVPGSPSEPEAPKPLEPIDPNTHYADWLFAVAHGYRRDNPPKHIPDRRWEEDFGSPRRFKGTY